MLYICISIVILYLIVHCFGFHKNESDSAVGFLFNYVILFLYLTIEVLQILSFETFGMIKCTYYNKSVVRKISLLGKWCLYQCK